MNEPFLKWAGGKRWLLASEQLPVPVKYRRYIEPFLGGGAVFFHLQPRRAILADVNAELIELYRVIRDEPSKLQQLMEAHQALHSRDHYYAVRSKIPNHPHDRAARTFYLNRTCWNGLYRVNLKGDFNVPIGTKTTVVFDGEDFGEFSRTLSRANLRCADFEETIAEAREGDFLFVDPPYTAKHNFNGFIKYNEQIFTWADQLRLRNAIESAIRRNVATVVTNADHSSIRSLYAGVCQYRRLTRPSVLAGKADRRGRTSEAMFTANL
jgi:DNA adenine methylase